MEQTRPETKIEISKMFDTVTLQDLMIQLAGRWMDEKKYEDIKDYAARIKKDLPSGFTIVKMTKRPFGFYFSHASMPDAVYQYFIKSDSLGWTRIK